MSLLSRRLFAETMHSAAPNVAIACTMIAAEVGGELEAEPVLAELDRLASVARSSVPPDGSAREIAMGLRSALGSEEAFRGYGDDYAELRASLLPEVLRRKRGLPILLSIVYVEVGRRLGVPVHGVGLPGHYVAEVYGDPPQLLDPFLGGRLVSRPEMADRLGGQLPEEAYRPWGAVETVARVLANIRALGQSARVDGLTPALRARPVVTPGGEGLRTALWAADLSLLLPNPSPALHRERGALRARLGDFVGGAADLLEYAELVQDADAAAAAAARAEAKLIHARLS